MSEDMGNRIRCPSSFVTMRRENKSHSDPGIEDSARLPRLSQANGIVPSMNRPRYCQDNAHMESFFHSLKAELTHQRCYASDPELNASLVGYIDRFYNEKRVHSSLGYHSRSSSNAWPMPREVSTKSDHARRERAGFEPC